MIESSDFFLKYLIFKIVGDASVFFYDSTV